MVVKTQDVRTPCYSDIYNIINNYTNTNYLYTLLFAKLYAENVINKAFHKHGVASFTGAWIETWQMMLLNSYNTVASFTGAWIETFALEAIILALAVASFTGAWIETYFSPVDYPVQLSHPLRVRGLKRELVYRIAMGMRRILYGCVD